MGMALFFHFGIISRESQTWSLMVNEKLNLYIVCTLIFFNPFHLTIESILTLIQSELWVQKCCCANSNFLLMFRKSKNFIKILAYCILWYLLYITFFFYEKQLIFWCVFILFSTSLQCLWLLLLYMVIMCPHQKSRNNNHDMNLFEIFKFHG